MTSLREILQASIRADHRLGEGSSHTVYRIDAVGYEGLVLRVPKAKRIRSEAVLSALVSSTALSSSDTNLQKALLDGVPEFALNQYDFGGRNFGQPIAEATGADIDILLLQQGRNMQQLMDDAQEHAFEQRNPDPFHTHAAPGLELIHQLQQCDDAALKQWLNDLQLLSEKHLPFVADPSNMMIDNGQIRLLDTVDQSHQKLGHAASYNTLDGVLGELARFASCSNDWHAPVRSLPGMESAASLQQAYNRFANRLAAIAESMDFPQHEDAWRAQHGTTPQPLFTRGDTLALDSDESHAAKILNARKHASLDGDRSR